MDRLQEISSNLKSIIDLLDVMKSNSDLFTPDEHENVILLKEHEEAKLKEASEQYDYFTNVWSVKHAAAKEKMAAREKILNSLSTSWEELFSIFRAEQLRLSDDTMGQV